MCQKALDLEISNGGERAESKCRKDKDHDLWYGTGSPAEFRLGLVWVKCVTRTRVGKPALGFYESLKIYRATKQTR